MEALFSHYISRLKCMWTVSHRFLVQAFTCLTHLLPRFITI